MDPFYFEKAPGTWEFRVLPESQMEQAARHPLIAPLMVVEIGYFPYARKHWYERPKGSNHHILIVCAEGEGWYTIGEANRPVRAHEALILPRGVPHAYGTSPHSPWSIYWVHFLGSQSDFYAHLLKPGEYVCPLDPGVTETTKRLFSEFYKAFVASFVLERMIYASQILHYLLGNVFFNNKRFSPTLQSSKIPVLDETETYLRQNLHRALTLDEMADHAGMSKSHFSRLFKKQTNYAPVDYFIHLKMQHATMLLMHTDLSVRAVGLAVGYDDPYYFSRIFKRIVGMSPVNYREQFGNHRHMVYPIDPADPDTAAN